LGVIQGTVEVVATISPDGHVARVRTLSGPKPLASAVERSLGKWIFAACDPRTTSYDVRLLFSFELTGACDAAEHCPSDFEVALPDRITISSKAIKAILN
jgi:hypothetical protein